MSAESIFFIYLFIYLFFYLSFLLLNRGGQFSESEAELDGEISQVTLPQDLQGRGNTKDSTSAIRLYEMGPRLTLKLMKIEEGVSSGEVLYHSLFEKTPEEVDALRKAIHRKQAVKAARRHQQELNVKRKKEAAQDKIDKKKDKKRRRIEATAADRLAAREAGEQDDDEPEDEREYFRQEVGVEPEGEMFQQTDHVRQNGGGQNRKGKGGSKDIRKVGGGGVTKKQPPPVKKPAGTFFRKASRLSKK